MKIFAFIFARGGSKGILKKNLKLLDGKPLLTHSINLAKEIKSISEIYVSTDDQEINRVALNNGIEVIKRPKKNSLDNSSEWSAWKHAIEYLEKKKKFFDIMLILPTTSPLRIKKDIIRCIRALDKKTDIIITVTNTSRSPWFNMVVENKKGYINLVNKDKKYIRRQDVPKIYDITTVAYVFRPKFVKTKNHIFEGNVKAVKIPYERSLDIDNEFDLKIAKLLIRSRKK